MKSLTSRRSVRKGFEFDLSTYARVEEILESKMFRNESEVIRTAILLLAEDIRNGHTISLYSLMPSDQDLNARPIS